VIGLENIKKTDGVSCWCVFFGLGIISQVIKVAWFLAQFGRLIFEVRPRDPLINEYLSIATAYLTHIYYLAHFPLSPLTLLPTPSLSATIHRC